MDDLGLMDYKARFYDPELGRFIQADSIVPGAGNPGAFNRYAYSSNNPINYTDPSGNYYCPSRVPGADCIDDDATESYLTQSYYQNSIARDFGINLLDGQWDVDQAQSVYSSLYLMKTGLDRVTGGYGKDWLLNNLSGTSVSIGSDGSIMTSSFVMDVLFKGRSHAIGNQVYLNDNFLSNAWTIPGHSADIWTNHEFSHIWEYRSSPFGVIFGTLFGGKFLDGLMDYVGGKSTVLPWVDNSLVVDAINEFDRADPYFQYGNNSPADYIAQIITTTLVFPNDPRSPYLAELWISSLIYLTK